MNSRILVRCVLAAAFCVAGVESAQAQKISFLFYQEGQTLQDDEWLFVKDKNKTADYVEAGSSMHNVCDVPVYVKPGYLFEGWYDWSNEQYMVYDANGKAFTDAAKAYWEKDSKGEIVWKENNPYQDVNGEKIIRLKPRFSKIDSKVAINKIETIYQNGMTLGKNTMTCLDANKRFVGVSIGSRGPRVLDGTFQGTCKITIDCTNYLSDEKIKDQDNVKSATFAAAPFWTITKVGNGFTIMSENKKYLAYKETALTISDDPQVWQISDAGYICGNAAYKYNVCMRNGSEWEANAEGIRAQDRVVKIYVPDEDNHGDLTSADIIDAVKTELSKDENKYTVDAAVTDDNLLKGLLYVDMSGARSVTESNEGDWSEFQSKASKNCLFFMPSTFENNGAFEKNAVCGNTTDGFTSVADFVLTDKEEGNTYKLPFYSPYDFATGSFKAKYTREISSSESAHNTMILPFSVKLPKHGATDNNVLFCEFGDVRDSKNYRSIEVRPVDKEETTPNTSYHVSIVNSENASNTCVIDIEQSETKVINTKAKEYETNMGDKWISFGNYFGSKVPVSEKYFYYNQGYYWNTSILRNYNMDSFYISPFRAYFSPKDENLCNSSAKPFKICFESDDEEITAVSTIETTNIQNEIYTLAGVKVKGSPSQHGIYIINGKKVLK